MLWQLESQLESRKARPISNVCRQAWTGFKPRPPWTSHPSTGRACGWRLKIIVRRHTVGALGIEVIHPDQFIVAQWDLDTRPPAATSQVLAHRVAAATRFPADVIAALVAPRQLERPAHHVDLTCTKKYLC
jgi:hypothetical protein